jgi:phosphatidylglycerophosphatase C
VANPLAPPAPERPGVAAFDFDGTLISGDSLLQFLCLVAGRGNTARACVQGAPSLLWALAVGGGRDASKAVLLDRLLAGQEVRVVTEAGERYAARLERRIRPAMAARIGWHRELGHKLVVVSASLALYLEPLGRRLGFDAVLATGLEVGAGGRLTGRLQGANVRRSEKAVRLRSWLVANLGRQPWELWAYGDSRGDRELLAMADHPVQL